MLLSIILYAHYLSYRVNHIYKDHNRKIEFVPYFFILLWHSSYISYGHSHRLLLGLPTTDFIIRLNNYFIFPFNFNYSSSLRQTSKMLSNFFKNSRYSSIWHTSLSIINRSITNFCSVYSFCSLFSNLLYSRVSIVKVISCGEHKSFQAYIDSKVVVTILH